MTLQALLDETIETLTRVGMDEAGFEARQLVQEALDITFAQVVSRPDRQIEAAPVAKIRAWARARAEGEPLAYLSRRRGFYKNDFEVEPGVLVPRPETELVVETALRRADDREDPVRAIADLGSGSGCIGLSVLCQFSVANLHAVDASEIACRVTGRNAERLGLSDRVHVERAMVQTWRPSVKFDLIVANPPYIAEHDQRVEPNVRKYEPALALFAAEDGLAAIREWSAWAYHHLEKGGIFVCEIGTGQSRAVEGILGALGFERRQVERDLAGHERVVSAVRTR